MQAPNASQIEQAADSLAVKGGDYPNLSDFIRRSQVKELQSAMGAETIEKLGAAFPPSKEFIAGYELGLQTARFALVGSISLMIAKIKPTDVL